jgi:general secretion pathway protein E
LNFLLDQSLIDSFGAQRTAAAVRSSRQPLDVILLELGLIDEHKLADMLSLFTGFPRINLGSMPAVLPEGITIPSSFLAQSGLVPVSVSDSEIVVATAQPLNDDPIRALAYFSDRKADIRVAVASELAKCLSALTVGNAAEPGTNGPGEEDLLVAEHDAERLRDIASEAPTIRMLNRIVANAIERRASDIHVEPLDDHVLVRLRIDGALHAVERLDRNVQKALVSRIKILAKLNIAEQRLPQDGRIRLAIRGRDVDFRVSTSPTLYGESVVLRVLDRKDVVLDFRSLGFSADACRRLQHLTETPNGIVLVTGPTGSGKTTTLYAALSLLNREELKVFTVEDPIEYQLKGANQILVRPGVGLDFATILRSILRQDPDVIMVGEIRDGETARIAVQASLTGHMVLSTLHTNSAAASITRLRDIGIEDYLIASTVRAIVAQRLVRKLCETCKVPVAVGFAAAGCPACLGTGFTGRTVVFEILEFDDRIRSAVLARAADAEIERLAVASGMVTLAACGEAKIADGETSRTEIARIVTGVGG